MPLTLGLIADTHGLLRPEAVEALRGVDLILHAGDVGKAAVLEGLSALAPVKAIRGNVDRGAWAEALPETLELELEGARLLLLHDLKQLDRPLEGFDAVVAGHSHKPSLQQEGGTWLINPGSAGPYRFRLPVAVARVEVVEGVLRPELVILEERG